MGEVLVSGNGAFDVTKEARGLSLGFGYGYTFHGKNSAVGSEVTVKLFWRF